MKNGTPVIEFVKRW